MKNENSISKPKSRKNQMLYNFYSIQALLFTIFLIINTMPIIPNSNLASPVIADVNKDILGSGPGRFNSIVGDDIDDDGRYEIVFGNYEGYVTVLEYRGDDFFEEWRSPDIGSRVWGITVANLVGDSTKEIIAGNGEGELYAYDAKSYEKVWYAEDMVRDVHGLLVHDLGKGGEPYLLAGTGYKTDQDLGTVYIFKVENNKINLTSKIGSFENRLRGVGVGDVDADGELEIVIGSGVASGENPGEGYVRVFNLDSALDPSTLTSETPIDPEWKSENLKGDCVALELEDFTGDGYPDIIVGNGYRYQAGWVRILTYNSESKDYIEYWKSPSDPDIGPKPYGLAVGDIDDDKNLEIVVGNQAGYVYIYEQSGSSIEQEWRSKLLGSDILGIDLADVDNDGQIEIIASQGGYTGKGDYTSGYTEPHIYIIDGKTHKIEHIIGETSLLDTFLIIIAIILLLTLLVGLNFYARFRKRLKELSPKSKPEPKPQPILEKPGTTETKSPIIPHPPPFPRAPASTSGETRVPAQPQTKPQPQPSKPAPVAEKPVINDPFPKSTSSDVVVNDPTQPAESKPEQKLPEVK
jgi:WD40 repeat protein